MMREIIGRAPGISSVREMICRAAPTDAPVLVVGESGTGKELVARAIHRLSPRSGGPFVAVSCAALPAGLAESLLFGHRRGAFTGAVADHRGHLASADGGTLFLDEIGDMDQTSQVKVLRALQEHEIQPVGAGRPIRVDVRIVAATNRDLRAGMRDRTFREDLYYRISVIEIAIPPLRFRGGDVAILARHFAGARAITPEAMQVLLAYDWPGNVRQLESVMARARILSAGEIGTEHLTPDVLAGPRMPVEIDFGRSRMRMAEVERAYMREVLDRVGWKQNEAARVLGIDVTTLYRKRVAYQLTKPPRLRQNGGEKREIVAMERDVIPGVAHGALPPVHVTDRGKTL